MPFLRKPVIRLAVLAACAFLTAAAAVGQGSSADTSLAPRVDGAPAPQGAAFTSVSSMVELKSSSASRMAAMGSVWVAGHHADAPLGIFYTWSPARISGSLMPDDGIIIKPADDANCKAHGCLIAQTNGQGISPQMFGAYCRGQPDDAEADTAGLQAAITAARAHVSGPLYALYRAIRTTGVCALNRSIAIDNFPKGQTIDLGGLIEGSGFPRKADWQSAQPFLLIGGAGGTQVGLDIHVGYARGLNADVIRIGPVGLGGSTIDIGYAAYVNGVIRIANTINVTDVNKFTGGYWIGCNSPASEACGKAGIVLAPSAGAHVESNEFSPNWIVNFDYGGVIENTGAHFQMYRGGMEANGQWLSQLCVSTTANFHVGDSIAQGAARGTILAIYPWRGTCTAMQIAETRNVQGGKSNFAVSVAPLSNAKGGSAAILSILTANQVSDPETFDIISNHVGDDPAHDHVHMSYLGGIVGNYLYTDDLQYANGAPHATCLQGVGLASAGGYSQIANCTVDPFKPVVSFAPSGITLPQAGELSIRTPSADFSVAKGKTAAFENSVKLAGVDGTVQTFPASSQALTGNTAAQILTNKTMSGASNTFSNIPARALEGYATGAWSPGDASGAGLALTAKGSYVRIGNFCQVWFDITFPRNANAAAAAIGNLPCKAGPYLTHQIQGSSTIASNTTYHFDGLSATNQFGIFVGIAAQKNESMSLVRLIGSVTMQAQ